MSPGAVEIDVALVGGGPGGLATAAAILSASDGRLRVKVGSLTEAGRNTVATHPDQPCVKGLSITAAAMTLSTIGCTLYRLCVKQRLASQVYESLKEYTLQGSVVGLAANAQYALEAIHPDLLSKYMSYLVLAITNLANTTGPSTL